MWSQELTGLDLQNPIPALMPAGGGWCYSPVSKNTSGLRLELQAAQAVVGGCLWPGLKSWLNE